MVVGYEIGISRYDKIIYHSKWIYNAPWGHASPYLVGIWLAYILRNTKKEKLKLATVSLENN
ncbi:hypothetical protein SK128_004612 [Halocaridina rubra]|uniref:Uncharacterized protein n=1 Tax=Halocaridina rubra TaxID=373956 RepID=A0AAN9FUU7_HALRR